MKVHFKCFHRSHFGDCLLCSPRNGVAVLLRDANEYLALLIRGCDLACCATIISNKYHEDRKVVLADLEEICNILAERGLVELNWNDCTRNKNRQNRNSCNNGKESEIWTSPIKQFYTAHELPCELHIDLTDSCNEKCIHCYIPHGQKHFLPYQLAKKVLEEFRALQGLTVQLSGGECMKHPAFIKICQLCRELDLNFIVFSNLLLCDDNVLSALRETEPQAVNVSLYSMDPNRHDAVTQISGSWERTMAKIERCQKAGIDIRLSTPLLRINKDDYKGLLAFADSIKVHLVPNCEIIPMYNHDDSNLGHACTPPEMSSVFRSDKKLWNCDMSNPRHPDDRVCVIGERLFLNANGQYYGCSGMNEFVIGDACRDSVSDVWNGDMMKWLRGLKNADFKKCVDCEHSAFCKVCPAFNFNATGSLFEPIPAKCAIAEVKHRVFGGK